MKRLLLFLAVLALPTIGAANADLKQDPLPSCYPFCPSEAAPAPAASSVVANAL
ncbi:MAG: hypothetical protein J0H49_11755 [Acidobacteria bacterium]|nr:hypothetical protein [Acidobacteriota bacterium]